MASSDSRKDVKNNEEMSYGLHVDVAWMHVDVA